MANKCLTLALPGTAGAVPERNYSAEIVHMRGLVEAAFSSPERSGVGKRVAVTPDLP